eukprot:1484094-Rhodomonas_salina.2
MFTHTSTKPHSLTCRTLAALPGSTPLNENWDHAADSDFGSDSATAKRQPKPPADAWPAQALQMLLMLGCEMPTAFAAAARDGNVASTCPVSRHSCWTVLVCLSFRGCASDPRYLQKYPPPRGALPLITEHTMDGVRLLARAASDREGHAPSTAQVSGHIFSTSISPLLFAPAGIAAVPL